MLGVMRASPLSPRAFSLVELLTALVLLVVGLAAVARAAGAIARLEGDARLRRVAAAALRARLDSVSAWPCHAAATGVADADGVHERWSVIPSGDRLLLIDSVAVRARPALSRALEVAVACQP
jgi:prepilin-type N-terminal cleavage/methylation domain-containing protein